MPQCPNCKDFITKIGTSKGIILVFKNGKWESQICAGEEELYICSSCMCEFTPEELDGLGVPKDVR